MPDADNTWFNTWPDGLIGLNKENRIVEVSPVARAIIGWTREELTGKDPHQILCAQTPTFQHTFRLCPLIYCNDTGETTSTLWKHKNGNFVSVDIRVIHVGYGRASHVISFVDNSTRQYNQAEMQKFSQYVEMSPSPIAEFVMDGQLLFGNSALQELLLEYGFDNQGVANVLPRNIAAIGINLEQEQKTYEIVEIPLGDKVFMWHLHLLRKNQQRTVVGYAFDITAQKEAEKTATEQRAQVRKEFYAKMVHELRTPLNAIVGFSDLLIATIEDKISEGEMEQLKLIKSAGLQLTEQVSATLDVAKIESGKMSLDICDFTMDAVAQEIYAQLSSLAVEKNLSLVFSNTCNRRLFSDKTKVRQIIINLVSNAIKYTQEGSVEVFVSERCDPDIGDCIDISVKDTGIGIKEEQIPTLFGSFEQIHEAQNRNIVGTGLGLSLVNSLVQMLGGKINVNSTYGVGSTFEVLLPILK